MKILTSAFVVLAIAVGVGCSTAPAKEGTAKGIEVEPGGALLWEQNCGRCHNIRQPRARSDQEWGIIVHHMRIRANLTAEEQRSITRFLQAAN